jgi:hypothetical protein
MLLLPAACRVAEGRYTVTVARSLATSLPGAPFFLTASVADNEAAADAGAVTGGQVTASIEAPPGGPKPRCPLPPPCNLTAGKWPARSSVATQRVCWCSPAWLPTCRPPVSPSVHRVRERLPALLRHELAQPVRPLVPADSNRCVGPLYRLARPHKVWLSQAQLTVYLLFQPVLTLTNRLDLTNLFGAAQQVRSTCTLTVSVLFSDVHACGHVCLPCHHRRECNMRAVALAAACPPY